MRLFQGNDNPKRDSFLYVKGSWLYRIGLDPSKAEKVPFQPSNLQNHSTTNAQVNRKLAQPKSIYANFPMWDRYGRVQRTGFSIVNAALGLQK